MIPWINQRLAGYDAQGIGNTRDSFDPVLGLTLLLQEIEQSPKNLLLMTPPRSVVFLSNEEGMYLFREGRRVPFASFASQHGLTSVNFRYTDPMDPSSGRRAFHLLTGWQGTAELIASAIKHSRHWKNLETIQSEVNPELYTVWATPTHDMRFAWKEEASKEYSVTFRRNQPVALAHVSVLHTEEVISMRLFPWTKPARVARRPEARLQMKSQSMVKMPNTMPALQAPVIVDLSNQWLTRFTPHDDFEINWR